jgi:hypothetical protein
VEVENLLTFDFWDDLSEVTQDKLLRRTKFLFNYTTQELMDQILSPNERWLASALFHFLHPLPIPSEPQEPIISLSPSQQNLDLEGILLLFIAQ